MKLPELCDSHHFEHMKNVTQGTFGTISLALDRRTMQLVVLKSVSNAFVSSRGSTLTSRQSDSAGKASYRLSPSGFGELTALRLLGPHDNILPLLGYYPDASIVTSLVLIFPLCLVDLHGLISYELNTAKRRCGIPAYQIKTIFRDILLALQHMHSLRICHGDINPRNILLTPSGTFQVADFGLARPFDCGNQHEDCYPPNGLCTLYYRPPELLFNSPHYNQALDMWSCGLVLSELLNLHPLFPGKSVIDQLGLIFNLLGTPSESNWPNAKNMPDFHKLHFQHTVPIPLCKVIPRTSDDPSLLNILQNGMLLLDPDKRFSAAECLEHPWLIRTPCPATPCEALNYFITSRGMHINLDGFNSICNPSERNCVDDNKSKTVEISQLDAGHYNWHYKIIRRKVDEFISFRKMMYHHKVADISTLKSISSTQDLRTFFQRSSHTNLIEKLKQTMSEQDG
jgi:serine/threonine protein kinase